jgi:hypothetical protein
MTQKVPEFELKKNPEYKTHFISGVFGTVNPIEGRIAFYVDSIEPQFKKGGRPDEMEIGKVVREMLVEVRMSPLQFKLMAEWMNQHLARLEKEGVKIPRGEERTYVT